MGSSPMKASSRSGGIKARRAAAAEDGDEGGIAQRRLAEASAAHTAPLDEGLDGLAQRCLKTCHDPERIRNNRP